MVVDAILASPVCVSNFAIHSVKLETQVLRLYDFNPYKL